MALAALLAWAALTALLAWAKITAGGVYGLMGLCEKATGRPPDKRASKGPIACQRSVARKQAFSINKASYDKSYKMMSKTATKFTHTKEENSHGRRPLCGIWCVDPVLVHANLIYAVFFLDQWSPLG
jgi:hypothetical protein